MRTVTSARFIASSAMLAAVAFAALADPEPCAACQDPENAGLCHSDKCRAQVLPVLRESSLKKDAHSGKWMPPAAPVQERTEATEHAARMARQADVHAARLGRTVAFGTPRRQTNRRRHGRA